MTDNEVLEAHINAIQPGTPEAVVAVPKLEETIVLYKETLRKFMVERQDAVQVFREAMATASVREDATSDLNRRTSMIDENVSDLNRRISFARAALVRLSK